MKWTCCISRIDRIWETYPTLLPRCAFILTDGTTVKKLSGWLPCHHANISYTLEINDNNIQSSPTDTEIPTFNHAYRLEVHRLDPSWCDGIDRVCWCDGVDPV